MSLFIVNLWPASSDYRPRGPVLALIPVLVILVFHEYKRRDPVFGLCFRALC